MKAEQWLRKRWGEIYIPKRDSEPVGLRVHLADANPARYGEAVAGSVNAGLRLHLSDTSNGINYGDADKGIKVHLAYAQHEFGDSRLALNYLQNNLDMRKP
jgi:hypothetical protein